MKLPQADISDMITAVLPEVRAIYLFGSANTAYERADSDIDIAFLSSQPVDALRRWELAQHLATRLGRDIDLVDLGEASVVLRAQVIAYGRRLYCADPEACERYEDYAFSAYARLNESRQEILRRISREGRIYAR